MTKEIYELTATQIIKSIQHKEFSALHVNQSFIKRLQSIDPIIKAWTSFCPDYVKSQANQIDASLKNGLLTGVPVGIKDVFNTEYLPTQKGSLAWKGYKAGNDARCVSYLRNQGGVVFGKTDTAELAVHANGNALNPHHLSHVTGSSSGGSAAAVASGMVPLALGTQTGGSTIRPASWCGVYAMKPSFGLIPRTGVLKTTDTLDTIGFFARCAEDLEILLSSLRIRGDNFPIQENKLAQYFNSIRGNFRIGFCRNFYSDKTETYVLDSMEKLKQDFSSIKDIEIVELALPATVRNFKALHRRIYHPCLAYYLKNEFKQHPEVISKTLKSIFADAKEIAPEDYGHALTEQAFMAAELENFFVANKLDFIITHSTASSAPRDHEPNDHADLNQLWTMTWLPVVNIPQFQCEKGLPYGFQIVGPRFSDYKLLKMLSYLKQLNLIKHESLVAQPLTHTQEIKVPDFA